MSSLDANALIDDADGLAFLAAVLRAPDEAPLAHDPAAFDPARFAANLGPVGRRPSATRERQEFADTL